MGRRPLCDAARFARLFHALLDEGVYIAPSPFEAAFVSLAHDDRTLDLTRRAMMQAFDRIARTTLGDIGAGETRPPPPPLW